MGGHLVAVKPSWGENVWTKTPAWDPEEDQ